MTSVYRRVTWLGRHASVLLLCSLLRVQICAAEEGLHPSTLKFEEGRELMRAGDLERACAAFEQSQELSAHVGTLLNLALCLKKRKLYASAQARYLEATELASSTGDDREDFARAEAARLEESVALIRLQILEHDETTVVTIGDQALTPSEAASGRRVDPGAYPITITQNEREPRAFTLEIEPGERPERLTVGPLVMSNAETGPEPVTSGSLAPEREPYLRGPTETSGFPWKETGIAAVITGGATMIAGGTLFAVGVSQAERADCRPDTLVCSDDGKAKRDEAARMGNWGIGLLIGGGVLAAAGATVWLLAPDGESKVELSLSAIATPGMVLSGRF